MKIDARRCFRKNEQVLCKEIEGERVLIDPYRRVLIKLNPVAWEIWQLLDSSVSVEALEKKLATRFDVDGNELRKDVDEFLQELVKREIVE